MSFSLASLRQYAPAISQLAQDAHALFPAAAGLSKLNFVLTVLPLAVDIGAAEVQALTPMVSAIVSGLRSAGSLDAAPVATHPAGGSVGQAAGILSSTSEMV